MANFLESEVLSKFLRDIESEPTIPKELVEGICKLFADNKLLKGSNLKKTLEDFTPSEGGSDES